MLTIAEVLKMPAVRSARPEVLAGHQQLHRAVSWVHTTELPDIGRLLRGGDLVLTTGIAIPDSPTGLQEFAKSLDAYRAAGLFVELGRRWHDMPHDLVETCEALGLPLVALRRETRFAEIAQAVGERLVDGQVQELRDAQRVHETFTELSINEAAPAEIMAATQRLAGASVVLESAEHRVLNFLVGPGDPKAFLDDWERRSRLCLLAKRTVWDESNGWLITPVGKLERGWGRLVIEAEQRPAERLVAVIERAAAALALHRLHDRQRESQTRRLHFELLSSLMAEGATPEVVQRWEVAGFPTEGRHYVGLAVRHRSLRPGDNANLHDHGGRNPLTRQVNAHVDDLVTACLSAGEKSRCPTIVTTIDDGVCVLLAVARSKKANAVADGFAQLVKERVPADLAAGTTEADFSDAGRSIQEAQHVLSATQSARSDLVLHRLADVHIRGLLLLLAGDERVEAFAARELAPLRGSNTKSSEMLMETLRALVAASGSKTDAATALKVSRPVIYDRIARLEATLGMSLSSADAMTSLHVALMIEQIHERPDSSGTGVK